MNLLQIFYVKILKEIEKTKRKKHHQAPLSTAAQIFCPERPMPNLAELINKNII
jgi:hypothetical protein